MFSSSSVRHSQQSQLNQPLISDDEQIRDLMNTLLDTIEKELESSSKSETCVLFHASTKLQRQLSKSLLDNREFLPIPIDDSDMEDSFQPLNEYKHSIGILLNEETNNEKENYNQVPSRKCVFSVLSKNVFLISVGWKILKRYPMSSIGHDSDVQ